MKQLHDVREIAHHFHIPGGFVEAAPFGSGHINDTYCAVFDQGGTRVRYVLQRINHDIFRNPVALMENVQRVTAHLGSKLNNVADASRRRLTLILSHSGLPYHRDEQDSYWRAYVFIEKARTFDVVESPEQAFEAAQAFGRFQTLLADLPAPRLHDTIPDFHNTPKRFATFEKVLAANTADRVRLAKPEIDFVLKRKSLANALIGAGLPERVTHNDTKINNVMLDDASGTGLCVIDLDTVMPGLALYDVGDLVRTATSPAAEDERDLSKVRMRREMFEAIARGYINGAGEFLTPDERKNLAVAGKVITFENGIRFLGDYLAGDTYYKIHREGHNLDRCRTQLKLVESIEAQEPELDRFIQSLA